MKLKKKYLSIFLVVLLVFAAFSPAVALAETTNDDETTTTENQNDETSTSGNDGTTTNEDDGTSTSESDSTQNPAPNEPVNTSSTFVEVNGHTDPVIVGENFHVTVSLTAHDLKSLDFSMEFNNYIAELVNVQSNEKLLDFQVSNTEIESINTSGMLTLNVELDEGHSDYNSTVEREITIELEFNAVIPGTFSIMESNLNVITAVDANNQDINIDHVIGFATSLIIDAPHFILVEYKSNVAVSHLELDVVENHSSGSPLEFITVPNGHAVVMPQIYPDSDFEFIFSTPGTFADFENIDVRVYKEGNREVIPGPLQDQDILDNNTWRAFSIITDANGLSTIDIINDFQIEHNDPNEPPPAASHIAFAPHHVTVDNSQISFHEGSIPAAYTSSTELKGVVLKHDPYGEKVLVENNGEPVVLDFVKVDQEYTTTFPVLKSGQYLIAIIDPTITFDLANVTELVNNHTIGMGDIFHEGLGSVQIMPFERKVLKGMEFPIQVYIDNIFDIYAAQLNLTYDSDKLEFVSYEDGNLIDGPEVQTIINLDDPGSIMYARSLLGDYTYSPAPAHGMLVTFMFRAKSDIDENTQTEIAFTPFREGQDNGVTFKTTSGKSIDPANFTVRNSTIEIVSALSLTGFATIDVSNVTDHSGISVTAYQNGVAVSTAVTNEIGAFELIFDDLTLDPDYAALMFNYDLVFDKDGFLKRTVNDVQVDLYRNNILSHATNPVKIFAGDVNEVKDNDENVIGIGDGEIGLQDVLAVANAFFRFDGQNGFNALVDFNRDGFIDIDDLYLVAIRFGMTTADYDEFVQIFEPVGGTTSQQ